MTVCAAMLAPLPQPYPPHPAIPEPTMTVLDADAYLQDRLNHQLAWLSKASRANKRTFLHLRILEVLLGTGITIFSPFATRLGWGPLAIALAGGGIAVSGSLLALNRHQENWLRYRGLAEALKREKYLFLTGTPPYDDTSTALARLVTACESMLSAENSYWSQQMSQQSEVPSTKPRPPATG